MVNNKLLGITITPQSKSIILYKIKKYIDQPLGFFHIVSLNPENLVIAQENLEFKKALDIGQIKLIDGVGIVLAGRLLGVEVGERVTGVELMAELIKLASKMRLRVLLIGARGNLAEELANCYQRKYPQAKFLGMEGIKDIKNPLKNEEERIFSIVADFKPHLVLVAFGSPDQELWIERHKKNFNGCIVMGVGGAFDFLSGRVKRAPVFIRKIGLEWLFRLLYQPWRWRRQLRLIKFSWLIFWELFNILLDKMIFFSSKTFFEIASEIVVNLVSGWIAILLSPLVLAEVNLTQYLLILTRGLIFSIIGLTISFWLREKSKKI